MGEHSGRHQHDPQGDEYRRLRSRWLWFLVIGTCVMLLGFTAISAVLFTTLTTVLLIGIVLLVGGVIQLVNAFQVRTWRGFFVHALGGVLHLLVGAVLVEHPLRAAAVLTLVLAVAFLVGGAARLIYGAAHSFPGRSWVLVNGAVTFLLGLAVWQGWPGASLGVIGLFVGIELVFSGWSLVTLGLAVKADDLHDPAAARA